MANIFRFIYRTALCPLLVVAVACGSDTEKRQKSNQQISYVVLGNKQTGYSYQIFISEKLLIDQTEIPAVGGLQKFRSIEQAEKVAKLVITKFNRNSEPPSVTINELDSLGITYNKIPMQ